MRRDPVTPASDPAVLPSEPFEVGPWRVEPLALRLSRSDGDEVRLEPRVMSLLVRLAAADGRPVTREDLVSSVWQGAFVSGDALHSAVSKLRRVLERGLPAGSAIETVPRTGYWLRLPVRRTAAETGSVAARADPGPAGDRSLAEAEARAPGAAVPLRSSPRLGLVAALAAGVLAIALAAGLALRNRSGRGTPARSTGSPIVRPLTSFPGLEVAPAFAPVGGGDRIAFSWKGPSQQQWDIYVLMVAGGPPLQLTHDPAADRLPAWSPDATRIAFVRRTGADCALWSVAALGGDERRLAPCQAPSDLAFASDGNTLFFTDRAAPEAPYRVHALELSSGQTRVVTSPPPGGLGDHAVAPAPRGGDLAFLRSPVLGVEDLWLLGSGGGLRRLTFDDLKIHGFDWQPDGGALIVSSNRGGLFSLWRVDVNGKEPTWLGVSGSDLDGPTVAADGRRVAFEQWQEDTNLYRLELSHASRSRPLIRSTRWDFQPSLSPNGARLAFVSDRTGSSELWIANSDGSAPSQRTRFGGAYLNSPQWSPDGKRIVFDLRGTGNGDLWVLEADDDAPRRLTDTPATDLAPSWSRDGRSVLFASDRSGSWELWRLEVQSGQARQVTRGGGYRGLETGRGEVIFSRADGAGLWILRPGETAPRLLVGDGPAPVDRLNWTLAGRVLVFVIRPIPDSPQLARLDLDSGRRTTIGPLEAFPFNSGLTLSPDGTWIALTRTDRQESDLLWMELPAEAD